MTVTKPTIYERLIAAQAEMKNPPLNGVNPHFKSKYSTLSAVLDAILPHVTKQQLFLTQALREGVLYTSVVAPDGEALELCQWPIPDNSNSQQYMALVSYARRGSYLAAFGLVGDEDKDGNDTHSKNSTAKAKPAAKNPEAPKRDLGKLSQLKDRWAVRFNMDGDEAGRDLMDKYGDPRKMSDEQYADMLNAIGEVLDAPDANWADEDIDF